MRHGADDNDVIGIELYLTTLSSVKRSTIRETRSENTARCPMANPRAGGAGRRPTMKEVAALAGVGIKTVSRVVNGEPMVTEAKIGRAHV